MKGTNKHIETICRKQPGWGAALRRLREKSGLSQQDLAEAVGVDRAAISLWEDEKSYPSAENLRKALAVMGVDPRVLFKYFGLPEVGERALAAFNAQLSPEAAAHELARRLIGMNGQPKEAIAEAIVDTMDNRVLAAVSMKALSDVQAAKLYFERSDKVRETRTTQRRLAEAVNVTPAAFLPQARSQTE